MVLKHFHLGLGLVLSRVLVFEVLFQLCLVRISVLGLYIEFNLSVIILGFSCYDKFSCEITIRFCCLKGCTGICLPTLA